MTRRQTPEDPGDWNSCSPILDELSGEVYFRAKKAHEDAGSHWDLQLRQRHGWLTGRNSQNLSVESA